MSVMPYDSIKEENWKRERRADGLIAEDQTAGPTCRTFICVNNQLEGNAVSTIAAMVGLG